ncbi:MSHA biogenesis protein MshK [Massilia sp. W12]|uniref:MSHA biogenesis protein MshK n=1 Tax=Massilia sp. W12 TaxID=3126507 RepID=UPI0030D044F2
MADIMKSWRLSCLCLLLCAAGQAAAQSEVLPDPTRPPPQFQSGKADASPGAAEQDGLRLESVLRAPGRELVIINGQTYRVGQMVQDAKLLQIHEQQVVLLRGNQKVLLNMYPDVQKIAAGSGKRKTTDAKRAPAQSQSVKSE